MVLITFFFFFFQAEDGIRDLTVTGVQTCALPIYSLQHLRRHHALRRRRERHRPGHAAASPQGPHGHPAHRDERAGGRRDPHARGLYGAHRHGRRGEAGRRASAGEGGVSIFVDQETRLLVQGITGRDGSFHTRQMISYGTKVVAGVTPGKGGQLFDGVVPVFDTVADAVRETHPTCSVIYVPAAVAASAILEAADAGLPLVVCITEGIPVLDMTRGLPFLHERGARLIGPNCPGLISPTTCKVGIIPGNICKPGRMGHAGAIISGSSGTAAEKMVAFERAGISVMKRPADVVPLLEDRL